MITDRRPWSDHPLRTPLGAETMLSAGEIDYLHWLGKTQYTGAGRVVELGSFLGGSTLALCHGLSQNPAWTTPLLAYDRFVMFNDQDGRYADIAAPGESFLPAFRRNIRSFGDRVTTRPVSIPARTNAVDHTEALYPEREPIEILFIDAAKSWPVHITILDVFGPHLIPGRSIVIQQDFKWATVFYLALHMHQLRDCFEPLHDVPDANTTAFLYTGGIESRLANLHQPTDFNAQTAETIWDEIDAYWLEHAQGDITHLLRLSRAEHLASLASTAAAAEHAVTVIESAIAPALRDGSRLFFNALLYAIPYLLRRLDASKIANDRLRTLRDTAQHAIHTIERQLVTRSLSPVIDHPHAADTPQRPTALLFGAGQFTRRLLSRGTRDLPFKPLAIIDDHAPLEHIAGIPVVRPSDLAPHASADLILIASDAHADALEQRARACFADELPIIRLDRPTTVATHA